MDPNDENTRHWLTFPNPKTPQYLMDIKQRLGQIKTPFVRPTSAASAPNEPLTTSKKIDADQRHFLDFNLPRTPDDLRAARQRIAKYRYNPSLDNHSLRPQTAPMQNNENDQASPPSSNETDPPKEDAWTNEEETKTNDQEGSTILVQLIDCDGMPNEYVQALDTANAAQEDYLKTLKFNNERRANSTTFRSPSAPNETKTESLVCFVSLYFYLINGSFSSPIRMPIDIKSIRHQIAPTIRMVPPVQMNSIHGFEIQLIEVDVLYLPIRKTSNFSS